jgi:hypothetical protein
MNVFVQVVVADPMNVFVQVVVADPTVYRASQLRIFCIARKC